MNSTTTADRPLEWKRAWRALRVLLDRLDLRVHLERQRHVREIEDVSGSADARERVLRRVVVGRRRRRVAVAHGPTLHAFSRLRTPAWLAFHPRTILDVRAAAARADDGRLAETALRAEHEAGRMHDKGDAAPFRLRSLRVEATLSDTTAQRLLASRSRDDDRGHYDVA
jgi:hypothetical protein